MITGYELLTKGKESDSEEKGDGRSLLFVKDQQWSEGWYILLFSNKEISVTLYW